MAGRTSISQSLNNFLRRIGSGISLPDAAFKTLMASANGVTGWGYNGPVLLDTQIGTGASAVISFSSINQNFSHLMILGVGRSSDNSNFVAVSTTFEVSPTAGAYNHQTLSAAATVVNAVENIGTSDAIIGVAVPGATSPANIHGSYDGIIYNYTDAIMKNIRIIGVMPSTLASGGLNTRIITGIYENTPAISLIRLTVNVGNWTTTSKYRLYGLP